MWDSRRGRRRYVTKIFTARRRAPRFTTYVRVLETKKVPRPTRGVDVVRFGGLERARGCALHRVIRFDLIVATGLDKFRGDKKRAEKGKKIHFMRFTNHNRPLFTLVNLTSHNTRPKLRMPFSLVMYLID